MSCHGLDDLPVAACYLVGDLGEVVRQVVARGARTEECVMISDGETDVGAARRQVVPVVLYEKRPRRLTAVALSVGSPDTVIDRMADISPRQLQGVENRFA